jgi:hypothetical protein
MHPVDAANQCVSFIGSSNISHRDKSFIEITYSLQSIVSLLIRLRLATNSSLHWSLKFAVSVVNYLLNNVKFNGKNFTPRSNAAR